MPSNATVVTVNEVGLYPIIPHEAGFKALYEELEERVEKKISLSDCIEK